MAESYIVFGHFCPVHHTCSAFPTHLPEPELSEESKDEKKKTMMMIMTKKTFVYLCHGNVMNHQNPVIWILYNIKVNKN